MLSKSNNTAAHVKKESKIDDWILQMSLRSFGFHNERNLYKKSF